MSIVNEEVQSVFPILRTLYRRYLDSIIDHLLQGYQTVIILPDELNVTMFFILSFQPLNLIFLFVHKLHLFLDGLIPLENLGIVLTGIVFLHFSDVLFYL